MLVLRANHQSLPTLKATCQWLWVARMYLPYVTCLTCSGAHVSPRGTGVLQPHHWATVQILATLAIEQNIFELFLLFGCLGPEGVQSLDKEMEEKEKYVCVCCRSRPPSVYFQSKEHSFPRSPCCLYRLLPHLYRTLPQPWSCLAKGRSSAHSC